MTIYWKISLIVAFLAFYGAAVWHIHDWRYASKQVKEMTQEQAATKEAMKASNTIDTGFTDSIAKLHQMELSANQQIEAAHETPATAPCSLDPRGLSVLRSAIAAGHPSR